MELDYRAAQDEDYDFLFELHRAVMREYVVETWGEWDEAWQQAYFRTHFSPSWLQIIQYQGTDIGVLLIQERAEEIYVASLEIHPDYQRQGIGSAVMRQMIAAARQRGKPVALKVLKANRDARGLYQRLGFGVTGEDHTHYIMSYEHDRGET
jgi:ribosomal protein S18 acetylase RimI-like enzyme